MARKRKAQHPESSPEDVCRYRENGTNDWFPECSQSKGRSFPCGPEDSTYTMPPSCICPVSSINCCKTTTCQATSYHSRHQKTTLTTTPQYAAAFSPPIYRGVLPTDAQTSSTARISHTSDVAIHIRPRYTRNPHNHRRTTYK